MSIWAAIQPAVPIASNPDLSEKLDHFLPAGPSPDCHRQTRSRKAIPQGRQCMPNRRVNRAHRGPHVVLATLLLPDALPLLTSLLALIHTASSVRALLAAHHDQSQKQCCQNCANNANHRGIHRYLLSNVSLYVGPAAGKPRPSKSNFKCSASSGSTPA